MATIKATDTLHTPLLSSSLQAFLLMRSDYAYIGWGVWGMTWPVGTSFDGPHNTTGPPLTRPPQLDADYGEPLDDSCTESEDESGVFTRSWSKTTVTLDCNAFTASITEVR